MTKKQRGTKGKVYLGYRDDDVGAAVLVVQGCFAKPLDPRFNVVNHSPTGFEWGYAGSGPAQLAFAILADALGDNERALKLYQRFKGQIIAPLERRGFEIEAHVVKFWAEQNEA